jgi:hypothetical protein
VFHSLQAGQRPIHLGDSAPQERQKKAVLTLAKANDLLQKYHFTTKRNTFRPTFAVFRRKTDLAGRSKRNNRCFIKAL